ALGVTAPAGVEPLAFRDPAEALNWFEFERENLVAAARSAMAARSPRRAWQLTMAASPIHMHHHMFGDWEAMAVVAVAAADSMGDGAALAAALDKRGRVLSRRQLLEEALRAPAAAWPIRRELGDRRKVAESLNALGLIGLRTRRLDDAAAYFREAAAIFDEIGDRSWQGLAWSNFTEARLEADDVSAAQETLDGILALFAGLGDRAYQGNTLWLMSWAARSSGDLTAARSAIEQALAIAEDADNKVWEAHWLIESARVHIAAGAPDEALECCRTAASLHRQIGDQSR